MGKKIGAFIGGLAALVLSSCEKPVDQEAILAQLRRDFPAYVTLYEQRYGAFEAKPFLSFEVLPQDSAACGRSVYPGKVIFNAGDPFCFSMGEYTPASVVKHELAHQTIRRMIKDIHWKDPTSEQSKRIARILNEGCAEYLTVENGGQRTGDYDRFYNFVSPVLSALGAKEGVERLFTNPPTLEEFEHPERYYLRLKIKLLS